jgi:23S rRNA (pseudouridine1915-N3)-methyltransferase
MKFTIIHTGKTKSPCIETICEDYYQRINKYLSIKELKTPEIKNSSRLPVEILKDREGEQLLKMTDSSDYLILFDERGKQHSSTSFALWLEKLFMIGKPLVFATGGAFGFPENVYRRANDEISLSKMTFPHQMVRVLVAEQIYRALTILKGEKYHH